jgi:hypothetical protein
MLAHRILLIGILTALLVVAAGLGFVGHEEHRAAAVAPNLPTDVAGLTYSVMGARPLDERGDEETLGALPADERRNDRDSIVYGVFISVANQGARPAGMAHRYELVDAKGQIRAQIPLNPASPFAYRPRALARGGQAPANFTPPASDLAEQGYPLVFRIPRSSYRPNDPLTLRVFDPTGRTHPADILVQV